MGQRHQYIVVFPATEKKPMTAKMIHHQWLYGQSAIQALARVLTLIHHSWDGNGSDYLFGRGTDGYRQSDGINAIAAAISVDPSEGYYHKVHLWDENGADPASLEPDDFDNNDGITLIQFEMGKRHPAASFITPGHLEGSEWNEDAGRGPWTATEYLAFYYPNSEQEIWADDLKAKMNDALQSIQELSRPFSKQEVQKLLPKFKV